MALPAEAGGAEATGAPAVPTGLTVAGSFVIIARRLRVTEMQEVLTLVTGPLSRRYSRRS